MVSSLICEIWVGDNLNCVPIVLLPFTAAQARTGAKTVSVKRLSSSRACALSIVGPMVEDD